MRADIEAAVIEILAAQLLLPPAAVAADARIDDLGLDSLGKVEAIFALEERFGITIPFNANDTDPSGETGPSGFEFATVPGIVDGLIRLIDAK